MGSLLHVIFGIRVEKMVWLGGLGRLQLIELLILDNILGVLQPCQSVLHAFQLDDVLLEDLGLFGELLLQLG